MTLGMPCNTWTKSSICKLLHFVPPSEPIGGVLDKYTDTLCNAQKKTSLESSLLQDIPT